MPSIFKKANQIYSTINSLLTVMCIVYLACSWKKMYKKDLFKNKFHLDVFHCLRNWDTFHGGLTA